MGLKYSGMLIAKAGMTLTSYQCKSTKNVVILSSLLPHVEVPSEDNPNRKSNCVLYYNQTTAGVDVFDQKARIYSVKAGSRWWPVNILYLQCD